MCVCVCVCISVCMYVATLVVRKSWKARMALGRDPREGIISLFGVDCYQGCWLCVSKHHIYIYIYIYIYTPQNLLLEIESAIYFRNKIDVDAMQ